MTLLVTCGQCGEKNNLTKLINELKDYYDPTKNEVDIAQAINTIKPKCGNCFVEMLV